MTKFLLLACFILAGCAVIPNQGNVLAVYHNLRDHTVVLYQDSSKGLCVDGNSDAELIDDASRRVLDIGCWKLTEEGLVLIQTALSGQHISPPDIFLSPKGDPVFPSKGGV